MKLKLPFRHLAKVALLLMSGFNVQAQSVSEIDQLLVSASPNTILNDSILTGRMETLAHNAIEEHCAACHGNDLAGRFGVPDLTDYDWLWGVTGLEIVNVEPVMSIMQTILYGIRDTNCPEESKQYGACPDTRFSQMPAYGELGYSQQQVNDLTELVLGLSGQRVDYEVDQEATARAQEFWIVCTECHGENGWGVKDFGGPDLTDNVWLYGSSREEIANVIDKGAEGACPPYWNVLDSATIKSLGVYIYLLSFGY